MRPIGSETQPVVAPRAGRAHAVKSHARHRGEFHRTLIDTVRSADAGAAAANAPASSPSGSATQTSAVSAATQQQTDALLAQLLQSELESSLFLGQSGSSQSNPLSGSLNSFLASGLPGASTQNPSLLLALMTSQLSGGGTATSNPYAATGAGSALNSLAAAASAALGASAVGPGAALGATATAADEALGAPAVGAGAPANINSSAQKDALAQTLLPIIDKLAPQYGLTPNLVTAVIQQESGFQSNATSPAGAMGLMQLMPATANMLGVADPYDPVANVQGGMKYLGGLLSHYKGDLALALAAYNAGPAAVAQYGGVPPFAQTQSYVADIMARLGLSAQQSPG